MLNTLQAGRALAALAVLLFHTTTSIQHATGIAPFWEVTQFGTRGVDFFFVLSGFIIMRAHRAHIDHPELWMNFIRKRFIRIFPIYWFYTALVVGALVAGLGKFPLPESGADWFATISLLRVTDTLTPLPQAWSLFHEILFYIGFSLLIIRRQLGVIVLVCWFLVSAATLEYLPAERDPAIVFFNSYNLNFALGIGTYYAVSYIKSWEFVVAVLGLVFIILATIVQGLSSDLLFGIGFSFLIAAGASIEEKGAINIPMAGLLGNASYSIYLIHEVVIVVAVRVTGTLGIANPTLLFILISLGALMAGVIAYQVFERPLLNLLRVQRAPNGANIPKYNN